MNPHSPAAQLLLSTSAFVEVVPDRRPREGAFAAGRSREGPGPPLGALGAGRTACPAELSGSSLPPSAWPEGAAVPRSGPAARPPRGAGARPSRPRCCRTGRALPAERDPRCPRGGAGRGRPGLSWLGSARLCTGGSRSARPARPGLDLGRPWGVRPGGGSAAGGSGETPTPFAAALARSPAGHARPEDAGLGDPAHHAARLHHHRHVDRVSAAGRPRAAASPSPPRRGGGGRPGCG